MGLSSQQKNKVVQLLGYGGKALQPNSVIFNKILSDRLEQLPQDTEDLVVAYLAQVETIETQIKQAPTRVIAKKVGDIELNTNEMQDLRSERRRIVKEMATHLDIPYQGSGGNLSVVV
jgi:hypothetical protein